jgi:glycosyltransferase involved in cell wall biosynthesis
VSPAAVSVVIPLHNKGSYIKDAVASVLAQTFSGLELLIIDDGSRDDGASRVKEIQDPRIILIQQDNIGVALTRNRGLKEAKAQFVAFLDADDLWEPDHLRHLMELSRRYPQAAMFGNRFTEFFSGRPAPVSPAPVDYALLDDYFMAGAAGASPFFTSSCMVNRTHALAAGGFPAGHSRGEDLALWMKLAATAPVAVSTYVGCHYRRGADTLTAQCATEPDVSMTTLDGLIARHGEWPASRRDAAREFYNRIALAHALDCVRAGDEVAAKRFLALSAGTATQRRRWWQARVLSGLPRPLRDVIFRLAAANPTPEPP